MKHLLIVLCALCFSGFAYVQDEPIVLRKDRCLDFDRSSFVELSASHRGNAIFLFSEKTFPVVRILVTDCVGSNVYEETASLSYGEEYSFSIGNVAVGEYTLIIDTEIGRYQGSFQIANE